MTIQLVRGSSSSSMPTSIVSSCSKPPANAHPLTAAITGFEERCFPRVVPPSPSLTPFGDLAWCSVHIVRNVRLQVHPTAEGVTLLLSQIVSRRVKFDL